MKKMILSNLAFVVAAIIVSLWWYGWDITRQYYLCDYVGIALILTAQKLLKNKNIVSFPIYIVGLLFNIGFGIMAKSIILILFSIYSIWIFIDNWKAWRADEKKVQT